MSDDRMAQARAEAERRQAAKHWRMWEDEGEHLSRPWSMGFLAGFREAVEWADANPRPCTITRDQARLAKTMLTFSSNDSEADKVFAALGVEVVDDE